MILSHVDVVHLQLRNLINGQGLVSRDCRHQLFANVKRQSSCLSNYIKIQNVHLPRVDLLSLSWPWIFINCCLGPRIFHLRIHKNVMN